MRDTAIDLSRDWQSAAARTDPVVCTYRKEMLVIAKGMGEMAINTRIDQKQFVRIVDAFSVKILRTAFLSASLNTINARQDVNFAPASKLRSYITKKLTDIHVS